MRIIYRVPPGRGWDPVTHMVRLAARLLPAELVILGGSKTSDALRELSSFAPRRLGGENCLVIAARPSHLRSVMTLEHLLGGHGRVIGWVIDSFWTEQIPVGLCRRHYDQIFVTDPEDADIWRRACGVPVGCLPWGADVLERGGGGSNRPIDLLRVGRMPGSWDDDELTAGRCLNRGIRFAGRPSFGVDSESNLRALMEGYAAAKFTLSFTNRVSPAPYTHPSREYLTARWTDALACGAIVAGVPPRSVATAELLWPGALLDLGTVDFEEGLHLVGEAASSWTPEAATHNYRQALQVLDWRWRFAELVKAFEISSVPLQLEIERLKAVVAEATARA